MVAYTEADIKKNVLNGTNESDTFTLTDVTKKTTVKANAGNDSINASASVADMAFYAGMGADAIETSQGNNTIYCGSGSTVVNINSNTKNVVIYPQNSKLTINFDDIPAITSDFFNSSTYETMTNAQFEQRFKKIKNDLKIIVSEDCSVTIKNYYKLDGIINVKTSDSGDLINIENLFYNYVMSEEKKYKITSTPGADLIKTHNLKDTIYAGNDDTIETYGGNDVIYAKNVSCDIKAGEGNDKLYLGNSDVLFDYDDNKMQGNDTIYFSGEDNEVGLGIDSSEIKELVKSKNNLILKDDKGNSITLANYFKSDENYAYVSGVELEYLFKLDITGKGTIKGTIFDEKITGSKYADKIYINTDDTVIAGKGNDKIYSEKEAENVVEFTVGDGKDTLYGYFKNLIFKDENGIEIDKNNLTFKQIGKDVIINYSEKDSVTLKNFIWDETWVYNLDSTMDNYQQAESEMLNFIHLDQVKILSILIMMLMLQLWYLQEANMI